MKITLFAVRHENKVYEFREPIGIEISKGNGLWCLEYQHLECFEFDRSRNELITCFADSVNFLWMTYAICEDSKLDKGARGLKQKLLKLITVREMV